MHGAAWDSRNRRRQGSATAQQKSGQGWNAATGHGLRFL